MATKTTKTTVTAGEEIDSKCLKCKDVTHHTIIAMKEEKIAKVKCNICGGKHIYRPAEPAKTKKKSAATKKTTTTKTSLAVKRAADNFTKILKGRNVDEAIPYAMTSLFSNDDLVKHPTFGVGIVTTTIPPNKIELTFIEGSKILICQLDSPDQLLPGSGLKTKKRKMARKSTN